MIVFHGTARSRAERIWRHGFLPLKPSRRVWFAQDRKYAEGRAKGQAKRSRHERPGDTPEVIVCEISLGEMRQRLGSVRVIHKGRVIAIDAPVGVAAIRVDDRALREELAAWVNHVLGFVPGRGITAGHRGLALLAGNLAERFRRRPPQYPSPLELFDLGRRYLPEVFKSRRFVPERITAHLFPGDPAYRNDDEIDRDAVDELEQAAIDLLDSSRPEDRERGIDLLREGHDPDLFDWCVMFLGDHAPRVRVAAARAMIRCRYVVPEVVEPLTESSDRLLRAAAIAVLARHVGYDHPKWFELGLKDTSDHVRVATATHLKVLDPKKHRAVFRLALNDPNPDVSGRARRAVRPKGKPTVARFGERL